MRSELRNFKFSSIYEFVNIVSEAVENGFDFWNFNEDLFVQSALKFNRDTLLHIYVSSTLLCHYSSFFRKSGDCVEKEHVDWWIHLMKDYGIRLRRTGYDVDKEDVSAGWAWFQKNETTFMRFFDVIADEVVYILFNDKQFLVQFNRLVRNVLIDENGIYAECVELKWPENARNNDGTIKRSNIPKWVQQAVFHRDKGRCVFCNKDLTGLVNTLSNKNFDHIIPLKDYGTNDPCNIQLACEECNKKKGGKDMVPQYKYQSWW